MVPPPIKAVRNFPGLSTPFLWLASVPDEQVLFPWVGGAGGLISYLAPQHLLRTLEPGTTDWVLIAQHHVPYCLDHPEILPHLSRPF